MQEALAGFISSSRREGVKTVQQCFRRLACGSLIAMMVSWSARAGAQSWKAPAQRDSLRHDTTKVVVDSSKLFECLLLASLNHRVAHSLVNATQRSEQVCGVDACVLAHLIADLLRSLLVVDVRESPQLLSFVFRRGIA